MRFNVTAKQRKDPRKGKESGWAGRLVGECKDGCQKMVVVCKGAFSEERQVLRSLTNAFRREAVNGVHIERKQQ